ncbi:hypothetical protein [Nocardioides euryhalodurans]|uniref:Uncharacterized protein n=1 Tax=Nocardioides euryhalodurans TaxID=2518370 RepID=A0A4P7GIH9_9ACTN|nr:hypothetical protein [Nocardioides euryhalodurans]QBR91716.1 hypothetical protein EXE57_05110 [Nocardioides euryhalodurans]
MDRRSTTTALAAAPALALAVAGLVHPHSLTTESADTWLWLHLVGMFVFPLVGAGLVVPLRGRRDPLAWGVRAAAFVYAVAYTALDVISGVTAGYVTGRLPAGASRPEEVSWIFRIGTPVGEVGSWALLLATTLLLVDGVHRLRVRALSLVTLPLGAWGVHVDHIFSPTGVAGMLLIAVGTAAAVWWSDPPPPARHAA